MAAVSCVHMCGYAHMRTCTEACMQGPDSWEDLRGVCSKVTQ